MKYLISALVLYACHGLTTTSTTKQPDQLIVTLNDGKIRGKQLTSSNLHKTYYTFQGIPYAKPPLGPLRFQPPTPNDPWTDILDATTNRSSCIQQTGDGSEDCLYINVWTPSLERKDLPVLFWIYGGAFIWNDGATYDPELLVEQDIVFVSFNYRLDVFGYLSTGDAVAPGNVALKDCVAALRWAARNVAAFGGDAQQLTIFGESAGGVHVSLLLQSDSAKGLFRGAIMDSATSLNLWGLARTSRDVAFQLGQELGLDGTNSSTLVQGLRTVDAKTLIDKSKSVYLKEATGGNMLAGLPYAPVREPNLPGAFFTGRSHQLLKEGRFHRVPVLLGRNSQEALLGETVPGLAKLLLEKFNVAPTNLIPVDMNARGFFTRIILGADIKTRYFGLDLVLASNSHLVKFVNSDQFNRPIQAAAKLYAQYVPTYFYVFSYEGALGKSFNRSEDGVAHSEELRYLFKANATGVTAQDIVTRNRMIKMWTNFVKFGKPVSENDSVLANITWSPVQGDNSKTLDYLDISANPANEN